MLDDVIDWLLMKAFAMLLVFAQPHAARELSFYETKSRQLFLIRVFSKTPPTLLYTFEKARFSFDGGEGKGWEDVGVYLYLMSIQVRIDLL